MRRALRRHFSSLPPLLEVANGAVSVLDLRALPASIERFELSAADDAATFAMLDGRVGASGATAAYALWSAVCSATVEQPAFHREVADAATRLKSAHPRAPRVARAVDTVHCAVRATFDTSLAESSSSLCYAHPIGFILAARKAALATACVVADAEERSCAAIAATASELIHPRARIALSDGSGWFAAPQWSAVWSAVLDAERRGLEPSVVVDSAVAAWALTLGPTPIPSERITMSSAASSSSSSGRSWRDEVDIVLAAADAIAADGSASVVASSPGSLRGGGSSRGSSDAEEEGWEEGGLLDLAAAAATARRSGAPLYILAATSTFDATREAVDDERGACCWAEARDIAQIITERGAVDATPSSVLAEQQRNGDDVSHAFIVRALS